jgi:hypothetical protein
MKKRITTTARMSYEHYKEFVLLAIVMLAIVVWLYEYHYSQTSDDLVGLFAALLLFLGTLLLGQGIRGWRDGEDYRHRYIKMKSRHGADVRIRKKKKRKW